MGGDPGFGSWGEAVERSGRAIAPGSRIFSRINAEPGLALRDQEFEDFP